MNIRYNRSGAHPDDKYLLECDLDEKGRMQFDTDGESVKFTDRAKAAQAAKWARLDAIYGPRKTISRSLLASRGGNPPRLAYGWAYKREFMLEYATHHNLHIDASERPSLAKLAGTTLVKYGELTEEQKENNELMDTLDAVAKLHVFDDLAKRTGMVFDRLQPFSPNHDWMLVLYTNYNTGERCLEMRGVGGIKRVIRVVQEALNVGNYKPELLWWYDWKHIPADLAAAV